MTLHPNVALVQDMDGEERDAFFQRQKPSNSCARCNQFVEWLEWADGEPSSLRSFLWELWDEHTDQAAEE